MAESWGSSVAGRLFTGSAAWQIRLANDALQLSAAGKNVDIPLDALDAVLVKPGVFWAAVVLQAKNGQRQKLDGIPNDEAQTLQRRLQSAIADVQRRAQVATLLRDFDAVVEPLLSWSRQFMQSAKQQLQRRGWLTGEYVRRQLLSRPSAADDLLTQPEITRHIAALPADVGEGLRLWQRDLHEFADKVNQRHKAKQASDLEAFFARVEKSPLTKEQIDAVLCFDNRVLLIAAAGSGKTSTMVAKAGYALQRGLFQPEHMLLLAFNNDAAKELGQRIRERLQPLGLPAEQVLAKTFHAFGLDVLGQATGKRPSLAPWVEDGRDLEQLLHIVDDLKDRDGIFRTQWDLFRFVLGQDLPKFGKETEAPDKWDRDTGAEGFWTLNNEVVKSRGEQIIANWLFYNGVRYQYEAPYPIDTADAQHRQYHPDFYFPDANAYLEHWAVDAAGEPPAEFVGYKEGMQWKRDLHKTHGTVLLETTMAGIWSGADFQYLETELSRLGVVLDPNPERPAPGRKPIENPRFARTLRAFMTHAKSNRLDSDALRSRLISGVAGQFWFRHHVFLTLYEKLAAEWEARLRQTGSIDFEDMLNRAADCIEQGQWRSPYQLVMVDEFQDASQARARLIASLVKEPDKHLFAVGDDWQSINRFAGADLSVMTGFEQRFGAAVTLRLETTFRCPQSLCDISSAFVAKNPLQLRKQVLARRGDIANPLTVVRVDDEQKLRDAVAKRLDQLASACASKGRQKILLLGRYQKDRAYLPTQFDASRLDVEFITVHASKGLEGDHVLIPRMTAETYGFPSRIADDPVLQLAMPGGETYEFAEERRLFYVALTRSRNSVTLFTVNRKESAFVVELMQDHDLEAVDANGDATTARICPGCGKGFLTQRRGRYGPFLGCSEFPRCRFTSKLSG